MPRGRIHLGTVIGIVVIGGLVLGAASVFWSEVKRQRPTGNEFTQVVQTKYGQSLTDANEAQEVPTVDDDPSIGPVDAPLTIIAFEDFECPYCGQVWRTEKQLMEEFDGKVRFVYRDFPISSIHANALLAAEVAECANAQGEFWAMHDLLFTYQKNLSSDIITAATQSLELDQKAFTDCLQNHTYQEEVLNDLADGTKAGVSGTPTYFFNGIKVEGALPMEIFRKAINYFIQ